MEGRLSSPTTPPLGYDSTPVKKSNSFVSPAISSSDHMFPKKVQHKAKSVRKALCQVILCIISVVAALTFLTGAHYTIISLWSTVHQEGFRGLRTADGFSRVCQKVVEISETEMFNTLFIIGILYIVLQAFCIPGTVLLNALMGALVGVGLGVPITVVLGTIGASCCYSLSHFIGVSLVEAVDGKLMKGKGLSMIRASVQRYKSDLFVYIVFLRLTPVLPNWLINLACPVVNVPLLPFAAATFTGIIPQAYLSVRFGSAVRQSFAVGLSSDANRKGSKDSVMDIVTIWDSVLLIVVAVSIVVAHRLRKKFYS